MHVLTIGEKSVNEIESVPENAAPVFIIARPEEVVTLQKRFLFDERTVLECVNLDEWVGFSNYDTYEFMSFVFVSREEGALLMEEINIYRGKGFLVLVVEEKTEAVKLFVSDLIRIAPAIGEQKNAFFGLFFHVFDRYILAMSEMLEGLEDHFEALQQDILHAFDRGHMQDIQRLRDISYATKKVLRPLPLMGAQIAMNAMELAEKNEAKYLKNIEMRLQKLANYADNIQDLARQLVFSYDSQLTLRTNDIVQRLTIITLFFAPLTVITGVYGMNFIHMPELSWQYGYIFALLFMAIVTFIMFIILKKMKWL